MAAQEQINIAVYGKQQSPASRARRRRRAGLGGGGARRAARRAAARPAPTGTVALRSARVAALQPVLHAVLRACREPRLTCDV